VTVDGRWCSLYRAIDADDTLIDSMLSETRDRDAAKRFFARARTVVGHAPEKVTTDGHDADPRAIRDTLGPDVQQRTSRYMTNRMEPDHRGLTQRSYPLRGFGSFEAAHERDGLLSRSAPPLPRAVGHGVRRAAGGVGDVRLGPRQADARHHPIAFPILTLPSPHL